MWKSMETYIGSAERLNRLVSVAIVMWLFMWDAARVEGMTLLSAPVINNV